MGSNLDMKDILTQLSERLPSVEYQYGDLSDIGNEVGYQLGQLLEDMTKDEIELFIVGFKHGISLTNGTH